MRRGSSILRWLVPLLGGASEPPFEDPSSIDGLLLWCAADKLVGLNDGDAVASFTDFSGNNKHPVCANAANKPTYKTGIINSLPALLFSGDLDANGDWLRVGFNRAIPETVFVVFQMLTLRSQSYVLSGYTDPMNYALYCGTADTNAIKISNGTGLLYANAGMDSFAIWTAEYNGANSKIYKAGNLVKSGNAGTGSQNGITIGADAYFALWGDAGSNENGNAHMYLAEVIIYDSVLTEAQRENVGGWLSTKYGLNF